MKRQNPIRLLLVDNDPSYRRSLRFLLELDDYVVDEVDNRGEAINRLQIQPPDLALIDLKLTDHNDPNDMTGLEVAKQAAEDEIPCIILTAYPSFEAVRQALRSQSGKSLAVDFVPKSNGPQAVIDAITRAVRRADPSVSIVALEVDLARQAVRKQGADIDLSRLQYALTAYLYEHRGMVCPPEDLIRVVYGDEMPPSEASADKRLERLIARLREKIEDDPSKPAYLLTVPGRGYRLELPA